jgi:hypothetical protein
MRSQPAHHGAGPALALVVLAPVIAEVLSGFTRLSVIPVLIAGFRDLHSASRVRARS